MKTSNRNAGAGNWMRTLRNSAVACVALSAGWSYAQAINDVPMAVKSNVAPNLMFMIDDSSSMLNIVPEADDGYNSATNYTPTGCSGTNVITSTSTTINLNVVSGGPRFERSNTTYRLYGVPGTQTQRCFARNSTYTSVRLTADQVISGTLRAPQNYGPGQYTGNYLNWYFSANNGPVTGWIDRKRLTVGTMRHRMDIAKAAADSVLTNTLVATPTTSPASVRVGLSTYNSGDGGRFREGMADFTLGHQSTMKSRVAAITANGSTPLAETLADIGRYMATGYSGNISAGSVTGVSINDFLRERRQLPDDDDRCGARGCLHRHSFTSDSILVPAQLRDLDDGRPPLD
jgi:type IV pilus assembly protein PilY1